MKKSIMHKTAVCLGYVVNKEKRDVGGLSLMFELFVKILNLDGYDVKVVPINSKYDNKSGAFSILRLVDYFRILLQLLANFIATTKGIFYFNPSTTRFGLYRDYVVVLTAKLFKKQVVMQQFGSLFESFIEKLSSFEYKMAVKTYSRADLIIVEGNEAKKQYSFLKNQDIIHVVQNGLPDSNDQVIKLPKIYTTDKPFKILYMNNMIESKGYVDVLKAVDILVNEYKLSVQCVFAGRFMSVVDDKMFKTKEEAQEFFFKYIKEHELTACVKYYNCIFGDEKANEFLSSHVFLLPSYYVFEGQPTAVLEALSYGCVPIVTNYRLIPEMVNETCGVFVKPMEPKSIANAIQSLIKDSDTYHQLSVNSINRFKAEFTQEKYSQKILCLVNSLSK